MSALGKVVRAGVSRRRVQTVVTGLAATMAVTASVLGGSLLVASNAPFEHAFAKQHGAQLSARFDGSKATATQIATTAHAAGVTASAGPFQTVQIYPSPGAGMAALPPDVTMPQLTVVGRSDPSGAVDDVTLSSGSWVTGPGQIVVSVDYTGPKVAVGDTIDVVGGPALKVVGLARSVTDTADAWVSPSEIAALTPSGSADGYQMLYRFSAANSAAQMTVNRAAVTAAAPAGAYDGGESWLDVQKNTDGNTALFVPFLTAFGALGVAMSVLIVGNVVTGAVGAGTRRIGILKALGFTPAQVVRAYMIQALIPAAAGTVVGAFLGNFLAGSVLSKTSQIYGTSSLNVAPLLDVAVVTGVLGLVIVAALVSALRAGRLRTVEALAIGRTPRTGRGQRAARITARLPLPRPITLGLAQPFARPARAATMVVAILFGAAAVTFSAGLGTSLNRIQDSKASAADVTVNNVPPPNAPGSTPASGPAADAASSPKPVTENITAISAAIAAQSGTRAYYGEAQSQVTAAGVGGTVRLVTYNGDASWSGMQMISGHWFSAPGEAVAPSAFLAATGAKVGDSVEVTDHGKQIPVTITGEVFSLGGMRLYTDARTVAAADPSILDPFTYSISVKPGTNLLVYINALSTALRSTSATAVVGNNGSASDIIILLDGLTALFTLMLVVTAGMGVLNAVVLDTRERVHDLGVAKALGMTPKQTVSMVVASVVVVGLIGGAIGVPAGIALQKIIVPAMGHSAGVNLPASMVDVYQVAELALLGLGGTLIAVLGSLMPATWAARTRTAIALRTE
jgi:putative ABC transport system permease protein